MSLGKASPAQVGLFTNRGCPRKDSRGGKRRGAGRKPARGRAGVPHTTRAALEARYPVHVVLRATGEVGSLRRKPMFHAIRAATAALARRTDFRIVGLSIQRTHVHMLVEAEDERVLSSGMQAFQISAARRINSVIVDAAGVRRTGAVFPDRYHASIIKSPTQTRHTIAYVFGNWRKHGEDRRGVARGWLIDWFSSASSFVGWVECAGGVPWSVPDGYLPLEVAPPQTWLLREGWRRAGTISIYEVPSAGKG